MYSSDESPGVGRASVSENACFSGQVGRLHSWSADPCRVPAPDRESEKARPAPLLFRVAPFPAFPYAFPLFLVTLFHKETKVLSAC